MGASHADIVPEDYDYRQPWFSKDLRVSFVYFETWSVFHCQNEPRSLSMHGYNLHFEAL